MFRRTTAILLLMVSAVGCRPGQPTATATLPVPALPAETATPFAFVPGGLLEYSGAEAVVESDPFRLATEAMVEVSWQHVGAGPFSLWLVNVSEEQFDPAYYQILVEDTIGKTSGSTQVALIAGDYVAYVEQADGPWKVSVKLLP